MDSAIGEKLLTLMGSMMQTLQAVTPGRTVGSNKVRRARARWILRFRRIVRGR